MQPSLTTNYASVTGKKPLFFYILVFTAALSTPVLLALLNKSYIRAHLMAAVLAFLLYVAGSMLLKFAEAAALGFIASLAALMATLQFLLITAEVMFLFWGLEPAALMLLAFSVLCCICNLILVIVAIKRFRKLKRMNARIQLWQFFAGFAASFLLVSVLGRISLS